jgi:hypothetical protein
MIPLHRDPHFTFRFADAWINKIDPGTQEAIILRAGAPVSRG